MKTFISLLVLAIALAGNFTIIGDDYVLNGKPIQLACGSFHYFRTHQDRWEDIFKKMANAGLNCVETYIAWNVHEPERGKYNFEGIADIDRWFTLSQKYNFLVIVRPGPYICAEWEFGGLPYWLLKEDDIKIRTKDPKYLTPVLEYYDVLLPIVSKHMINHGGNIIMTQIENEYGSYPACDKEYLTALYDSTVKNLGSPKEYVIFTTDGPSDGMITCGRLEGKAYTTVDFGPGDAHSPFAVMRKYEPSGPYQNTEFYPGWLDHWKEKHSKTAVKPITDTMQEMHDMKASFNFYMFIGGTNFGFMNGANGGGNSINPQPTSYDYDAPLSEAGDRTEKYKAIQEKIASWGKIPHYEVEDSKKINYGEIEYAEVASLWDNLDVLDNKPVENDHPMTMEHLDLDYGFVLYRTKVSKGGNVKLDDVHDRAYIYVNRHLYGIIERQDVSQKVTIEAKQGDILDILVENMGRVNYGGSMTDPKGILGNVYLDGEELTGFVMYRLGMKDISKLQWKPVSETSTNEGPAFYKKVLKIDEVGDTFINPKGWNKGHIYVNNFNIGRYWTVGPQLTLYVPGPVLREGANTIVAFELIGADKLKMSLDDVPQIDII